MPQNETNTHVLGAGKVFFDPFDSNGALTGERYLGDTPGFQVSISTETQSYWDNDGPIAQRREFVATQLTRNSTIEVGNISLDNLALFIVGTVSEQSQSGNSVTGEEHTVDTDRWYQLGRTDSDPLGARSVSGVTVSDGGGTTTYTEGTDYELDAELGRIRPIPGAGISDGDTIAVDYDTDTVTWDRISGADLAAQDGALRFIADNTAGPNRDLYAPKVRLNPDGDFSMKSRDTWQQLSFSTEFLKPDTADPVYIEGRPA